MNEKITVVVITRNREKMLAGCLESLVKQTYLPDEVIVIDNASTDSTKRVIFSFKKKLPIRYVEEKQIGIPYARNKGIRTSRGTLLLMLDDDCEADKFWIEKMIKTHRKYPKAWVIQGRTYSLPRNGIYSLLTEFDRFIYLQGQARMKQQPFKIKSFFYKNFKEEIELLSYCDTKNFSIKTLYLKKYKLIFDTHFYRGSDTDFGRQILQKKGLIMYYPHAIAHHRERSNFKDFLEQRWDIGRTEYRIAYKWNLPMTLNIKSLAPSPRALFNLYLFCKVLNQLHKLPVLTILFFLVKIVRLNGFFYEMRILSLKNAYD